MDKSKHLKNCARFFDYLKRGRGSAYIGENTILSGNVVGQQILTDTRHSRAMHIACKPRPVDMGVMAFLHSFVMGGMVGAEIDAACGFYSILLTSVVGPSGKIYSFEPIPECYELIIKNTRMNDVYNIEAVNKAVLDNLKRIKLEYFDVNYQFSFSPPEGYQKKECIAEATTLDNYLESVDEPLLDFLIINNDKDLPLIWQGMLNTLEASIDIKIVCRFNLSSLRLNGHDPAAFLDHLSNQDFKFYLIPTLDQIFKDQLLNLPVERTIVLSRNEL